MGWLQSVALQRLGFTGVNRADVASREVSPVPKALVLTFAASFLWPHRPAPLSAVPSIIGRVGVGIGCDEIIWWPHVKSDGQSRQYIIERPFHLRAAAVNNGTHPYFGDRMNQPAPTQPTGRRDTRGQACVNSLLGIKRRTGVTMPKHLLLKMAFDSGYEAGAEDASSGELLVETLDLP